MTNRSNLSLRSSHTEEGPYQKVIEDASPFDSSDASWALLRFVEKPPSIISRLSILAVFTAIAAAAVFLSSVRLPVHHFALALVLPESSSDPGFANQRLLLLSPAERVEVEPGQEMRMVLRSQVLLGNIEKITDRGDGGQVLQVQVHVTGPAGGNAWAELRPGDRLSTQLETPGSSSLLEVGLRKIF